MERGLDEPALAQPDAALGQKEPVAEHPREQADAGALDEVPAPRDQDLLDGVRVVDEQPAIRPEAQRHDVAVFTRARRVEAELIAGQVGTASEEEVASRPSGNRLDRHEPPVLAPIGASRSARALYCGDMRGTWPLFGALLRADPSPGSRVHQGLRQAPGSGFVPAEFAVPVTAEARAEQGMGERRPSTRFPPRSRPPSGAGVNGAEPGDVMEIRILKITPKAFATNFNLPGKEFPTIGALAAEMPDGFVKYFYLDLDKKQAEFKPGITIDLQPFPGTLAVGIDPKTRRHARVAGRIRWRRSPRSGRGRTARTWTSTRCRPGRPSSSRSSSRAVSCGTGDSHCRQGNGEVNLTALECSYREIVMQLIVRKDMKLDWPRIETPTHWIMTGFDEDLNKAMVNAVRETVDFLAAQNVVPLTRYEAYSLTSMVGDCRVSQVVDVRKGVHCMVPKSVAETS